MALPLYNQDVSVSKLSNDFRLSESGLIKLILIPSDEYMNLYIRTWSIILLYSIQNILKIDDISFFKWTGNDMLRAIWAPRTKERPSISAGYIVSYPPVEEDMPNSEN
jgi:hypothetical protein